jgi:hypothetical protein
LSLLAATAEPAIAAAATPANASFTSFRIDRFSCI